MRSRRLRRVFNGASLASDGLILVLGPSTIRARLKDGEAGDGRDWLQTHRQCIDRTEESELALGPETRRQVHRVEKSRRIEILSGVSVRLKAPILFAIAGQMIAEMARIWELVHVHRACDVYHVNAGRMPSSCHQSHQVECTEAKEMFNLGRGTCI